MARVRSSRTRTKPAGSPLGETSAVPSAPTLAMKTKGEAAMKRRLMSSMTVTTLATARSCAWPVTARISASLVTTSRKRAARGVVWFMVGSA